ncbi:hypothetical protein CRP01_17150 [Flavilitoribacter nigricans DSM 23189 = NBRC 102662]|uniref:Uncharacterized protein n=1 Tax=Flavilitoribacter nigricans (strain ATCC 23147 / DSM 23189 / NBRC 102662 / NCIMB 1420 / SS-2) TaxID=1122177 RepID=A0A2D0N9T5_FLAN2|nr:hypothetical protein CRP01_17150 [Flavilitoribacter nigricans DSM 23189 = NBRC 102662]
MAAAQAAIHKLLYKIRLMSGRSTILGLQSGVPGYCLLVRRKPFTDRSATAYGRIGASDRSR